MNESGLRQAPERPGFNREAARQKLQTLLAGRVSFDEIVDLLGAEDFVRVEQKRSESPVRRFDVEGFLNAVPVDAPEQVEHVPLVILPPDEGRLQPADPANPEPDRFERSSVPRTRFLVELLSELRIPYKVYSGEVNPAMVRREAYRLFVLPGKQALVFVNNEAGNATYVVSNLEDAENEWREFAERTKQELRSDDRASMVLYHGDPERWKADLTEALTGAERRSIRPLISAEEVREFEQAPERPKDGWLNLSELTEALGYKNGYAVHDLLRKHESGIQPEWIRPFRDRSNKVRPHYAQELVEYLSAQLLDRPPDGWLPFYKIQQAVSVGREDLRSELEEFKQTFPAKAGEYGVRGKEGSYFSPDVLDWLNERERVQPAPPGWMTMHQLSVELNVTDQRIARRVETARKRHPEWVKPYLDPQRRTFDHISPELAELLREEFSALEQIKPAPDGWMTLGEVAAFLAVEPKALKGVWREYKTVRPNDFQTYRNAQNKPFEYISPELIHALQEEYASVPKVPDGWVTHMSLAKGFGTTPQVIANIAERYRAERPEWFGKYRRGLDVREYYAPELQERIRQDYVPKRRSKQE